tara:strand:- start:6430 stop:7158 length:729 start_codon:yes stop_codon:yes gene_type:complete
MGEIDYNEYRSQLPSMYGRSRKWLKRWRVAQASRGARRREIAPRRMIRTRPMPPRPEVSEPDPADTVPIGEPGNVLWRKRLSRSDLGITRDGGGTHVTGNIKFTNGYRLNNGVLIRYTANNTPIDISTYFRDDVFVGLEWEATGGRTRVTQVQTIATIQVFLQGEFVGDYEFRISHDDARSTPDTTEEGGGSGGEPTTWLHTTPEIRQSFCDEAFLGGYVELCGEAGSEGPFELRFYTNPQA